MASIIEFFSGLLSSIENLKTPKNLTTDQGLMLEVERVRYGAMGVVYFCRQCSDIEDDEDGFLALKTFSDKYFFSLDMTMIVKRETSIWAQLADVSFVFPLISIFMVNHKPHLVMPVAKSKWPGVYSLADAIKMSNNGLDIRQCLVAAICISIAMSKSADKIPGLVHGDIKPDNILYLGQYSFLSDFGLAGIANEIGQCGTPAYMAPELWDKGTHQSVGTDVYAFGATLGEMLTGTPMFAAKGNDLSVWKKIHQCNPAKIDSSRLTSPLADFLKKLALSCLSKDSTQRPENFYVILSALLEMGMKLEPELTRAVSGLKDALERRDEELGDEHVAFRIQMLLDQGDVKTALKILMELTEDDIVGELLRVAGSTWSLAGDDLKALDYFERYLVTEPSSHDRIRCLNELGLSLKRLSRYEEAKSLFEELIAESTGIAKLQLMVRSNYVAVLAEMDLIFEATKQLDWLMLNHSDSDKVLAMYAQVLERSEKLDEALSMIQRAVLIAPRNGEYQIIRADLLLSLRRFDEALHALDRASDLGFLPHRWWFLSLVAYMAMNRAGEWAGVYQALEKNCQKEVFEALVTQSVARVRSIMGVQDNMWVPESEKDFSGDKTSTSPLHSSESSTPIREKLLDQKSSAGSQAVHAQEHRRAIRTGKTTHTQIRMSHVDGSFTIDFYGNVKDPNYAKQFLSSYNKIKWKVETDGLKERQMRHRFSCCQKCAFDILTARDEGESFVCQACGERGLIQSSSLTQLDSLAVKCNELIGRPLEEEQVLDETLLVAFWISDEEHCSLISLRMEGKGYLRGKNNSVAASLAADEMKKRTASKLSIPQFIWYRKMKNQDAATRTQSSLDLDALLRQLRREVGVFSSCVMRVGGELGELVLADGDHRLEYLKSLQVLTPHNMELKGVLVSAELASGNLKAAQEVVTSMEHDAPDNIETLIATCKLALHMGNAQRAIPILQQIAAREPGNVVSRELLMQACQEIGDTEQYNKCALELRALGVSGDLLN
ncbi:serine/threonine protein kinase [Pseudomonas sp. GM78]|uniref:protein kinase family protein n=1 Tax=Pseudomonas sp. GM78 TaxID=1144337 RepID=UPI00026F7426|nr:protein kinase family protein [Pseudomonas sp. GM78]EJN31875.1 serine/threonine protein kinase [Pseudomonas sp. GM78]